MAGASVLGVAIIGLLVFAVTFATRQFDKQPQAPLNFVDPTYSASATTSSATETVTSTEPTVLSTSPPVTSDIDGSPPLPTSSDSTTSETSSSTTSPPTSRDTDGPATTRKRPRTNVTRTLYPPP